MRKLIVNVPSVATPIKPSPGFAKKKLSSFKLDIMGLCEFGCRYCSSNLGNYLRIRQKPFLDETERQTGTRTTPMDEPRLTFHWPEVFERLEEQLRPKKPSWGAGETLVFSMLTDGFSPELVKNGTTESALRMVLERTSFRIRILTKNATVGSDRWIQFFSQHPGRFVVGLSTGTMDDSWARSVEIGTSPPTARLRALSRLQQAGVPTYGMLAPIFPDVLTGNRLEKLVDAVNPAVVEHVWAEPFNDRANWRVVREGYPEGSPGYRWFTEVFDEGKQGAWSAYATELYVRLRDKARKEGWLGKLRYLLYELGITANDAPAFGGLEGVLLQSKPNEVGLSKNPHVAALTPPDLP